ncbi:MAG: DNA-deoxyinosine glycosylase [Motiliproteus sp.]
MSQASSFDPVITDGAQVLILGSMPGLRSLEAQQYYAHPRNAFWPIMAELFGFDSALPYDERLRLLQIQRVALWDVLADCYRPGSLDSAIVESSIQANDFPTLLQRYPTLKAICFNGAKAEQSFRKHVRPLLGDSAEEITFQRLPSTSPAHASLSYDQKLCQWQVVTGFVTRVVT